MIYETPTGHSFESSNFKSIEVFTTSEVDEINPGKIVKDANGDSFTIIDVKYVAGRLYKISLLPVPEA